MIIVEVQEIPAGIEIGYVAVQHGEMVLGIQWMERCVVGEPMEFKTRGGFGVTSPVMGIHMTEPGKFVVTTSGEERVLWSLDALWLSHPREATAVEYAESDKGKVFQ